MENNSKNTATPVKLETNIVPADWDELTKPDGYVPWDNNLVAAANVALALGKPLLLTGAAGVGKSEFSRWLAHELGFGEPEKFVVKSTTEAGDLFYHYDTLGRFHEAHIANYENITHMIKQGESRHDRHVVIDPLKYLSYQALGKSILYSKGKQQALQAGFITAEMAGKELQNFPATPRRTVVLIDEIDKAPRDVPNDILDEIDKMAFSIREIGGLTLQADKQRRPVVVITSNSERDLPEPFLRRCIFYHIPFPERDKDIEQIVLSRLSQRMAEKSPLLQDALTLLRYLRGDTVNLLHKPGIAELLDWLYALTRERTYLAMPLAEHPQAYIAAKTTLLKNSQDQINASLEEIWLTWLKQAGISSDKPNGSR